MSWAVFYVFGRVSKPDGREKTLPARYGARNWAFQVVRSLVGLGRAVGVLAKI